MDSACGYGHTAAVIHELTQAIQTAKQLRVNLDSAEAREFLIQKILYSYENALSVLKSDDFGREPGETEKAVSAPSLPEVSTENEEFEFEQTESVIPGKRKEPLTWEDQTIMGTENGLEGNTDDGYSWRKYGQKDILGAKFPRSYYRCSFRKVQNCRATKQAQRTDENPKVFEIAYKGKHTCNHGVHLTAPPTPPAAPPPHDQLSPRNPSVNSNTGATIPPPFGFTEDNQQLQIPNHFNNELLQVYSPPFISPATSESNYFSEWGSSPSLDFPTDSADVDHGFEFHNSFFY